jgi:fumarylacetoacetase
MAAASEEHLAKRRKSDSEESSAMSVENTASASASASGGSALRSWVQYSADTDFPIENIPFGVFRYTAASTPAPTAAADAPVIAAAAAAQETHVATAIGDYVLDLHVLAQAGLFKSTTHLHSGVCFLTPNLNAFMALGRPAWREARAIIQQLLHENNATIRDNDALRKQALLPRSSVTMVMPATIGDYTDFYSSRQHAYNVGVMFRGKDNALQPNWLHLPVGYHGRASSVVVSGTDLHRPYGQIQAEEGNLPPCHFTCARSCSTAC